MKTNKQIEATTVNAIKTLSLAVSTLSSIHGNTDRDLFVKQAGAFMNALKPKCDKWGVYEIPAQYNSTIDDLYSTKTSMQTRRAVRASLVACFDLGKHGQRAVKYLEAGTLYAKQKGITVQCIDADTWLSLKAKANAEMKKDADKAKHAPTAPTAPTTPTAPTAPTAPTTTASKVDSVVHRTTEKVKLESNLVLGKESETKVNMLLNSISKSWSEPELKRLAVLIEQYLA